MILRPDGSRQLLITQPDHASLAARMMEHWRADGLPDSAQRAAILLAIAQHDNGWKEIDAAPIVDSASGRILDFMTIADEIKRDIWPRGVTRLEDSPYAAALVAQHALHIYRRYRTDSAWASFFVTLQDLRDRYLEVATDATLDQLLYDYQFVRIGDLASLTFCNAWTEPQTEVPGYQIALLSDRLVVTPDPFAGREIPFDIAACPVSDRPYTWAEAVDVFREQPKVHVTGVLAGA